MLYSLQRLRTKRSFDIYFYRLSFSRGDNNIQRFRCYPANPIEQSQGTQEQASDTQQLHYHAIQGRR